MQNNTMKYLLIFLILLAVPVVMAESFELTGFSVKSIQTVNGSDNDIIYINGSNRDYIKIDRVYDDSVDLTLYRYLYNAAYGNLNKEKALRFSLDNGDLIIKLNSLKNGKASINFEIANTTNNVITSKTVINLPEKKPSNFKSIIVGLSMFLLFILMYLIYKKE